MKKIIYFFEFILIKILFFLFEIIGYQFASNLGFVIGKTIGPIFRSKKIIIQNLEKANIKNLIILTKLLLMCLVIMEEFLPNMFI